MNSTADLRIAGTHQLVSPDELMASHPSSEAVADLTQRARAEIADILHRRDARLLVVVGPCSVHDPAAAVEYAERLAGFARSPDAENLLIVMRVYFEKPRTTVGWKGLINDPGLNGSFEINQGLGLARQLLLDIAALGLPAGTEFLEPITPQYLMDVISWGAIGARTTESQVHRELVSGLSCPVGFKNGTDGRIGIAVDAMRSAAARHAFLGIQSNGGAAIFTSRGNPDTHIILRGGASGPNYSTEHIADCTEQLRRAGLDQRLLVDMSHGNSLKQHKRQLQVCADLCKQIAAGGDDIAGVMIESNLVEGNQSLGDDPGALRYGQSITDACIHWEDTEVCLRELNRAAAGRLEHRA
ncbi:MAG: 3-deoxy-7-phosphoheptulonate synthase [Gammaproteobacteria bacterium AqS3]|nr:3-deoxy-7-phosphoheptulonate synthase [Gammaproteobacteria bacterium AqS3]